MENMNNVINMNNVMHPVEHMKYTISLEKRVEVTEYHTEIQSQCNKKNTYSSIKNLVFSTMLHSYIDILQKSLKNREKRKGGMCIHE